MNRLTKKSDSVLEAIEYQLIDEKENLDANEGIKKIPVLATNKLGKLEDIEEELGIDLITLFKALKQKFVFRKENVKIELIGIHIKSEELYLFGFIKDTVQAVYLSLKDYQKTWFLTKEELEDETIL